LVLAVFPVSRDSPPDDGLLRLLSFEIPCCNRDIGASLWV
jgi:hypothetical protein